MPVPLQQLREFVVRIPVDGPQPNNTLAHVRCPLGGVMQQQSSGDVYRHRLMTRTPFRLEGFSQRTTPEQIPFFRVSATAWITMIKSWNDQSFLTAIDDVHPWFDEEGWLWVDYQVATIIDDTILESRTELTAWVLCWEPPPPQTPTSPPHGRAADLLAPSFDVFRDVQFAAAGTKATAIEKKRHSRVNGLRIRRC